MQRMNRSHAIFAGIAGTSLLVLWAATAGANTMPPVQTKAEIKVEIAQTPAMPTPAVRVIPLYSSTENRSLRVASYAAGG